MRTYEALYIVRPDVEDEQIQTIAKEVETLVTQEGGAIVRSEIWGKRRLAYEVKQFSEGAYVLLRFTATPEFIPRLEHYFRLAESVIRYLTVYFDEKMLRLEEEQKERKEQELLATAEEARRRERRAASRRDDDVTAPIGGRAAELDDDLSDDDEEDEEED